MKKKRIVALILAGTLLAGQTVYAQGTERLDESAHVEQGVSEENENLSPEEIGGSAKEEQIAEGVTDDASAETDQEQSVEKISEKAEEKIDSEQEPETEAERKTTVENQEIVVFREENAGSAENILYDEAVISDENLKALLLEESYYDPETGTWISFGEDGYVSVSEMETLTSLSIRTDDHVTDVSGLKQAVNLQTLSWNCSDDITDISSLSELSSLDKLTILSVHGNGITDISAVSDLKNLENVFLSQTAISDVSPLAALPNLTHFDLTDCPNLTTIEPLMDKIEPSMWGGWPSLTIMYGTPVSDQEKLEILRQVYFSAPVAVGDCYDHSKNYMDLFIDDFTNIGFDIKEEDSDCLEIVENGDIYARKSGTVTLILSLRDAVLEVPLTVYGTPEGDSALGAPVDYTVEHINTMENMDTYSGTNGTSAVLKSNGELWKIYPEVSLVRENVESYISGWFYSGTDVAYAEYILDKDHVLWDGETELADHVQKFDGHYVLNTDHVLIDIYNNESVQLEGVSDWVQTSFYNHETYDYERATFVLKQDGSLWCRKEVAKDETVNPFRKTADGVKELFGSYYLAQDGQYYNYDGTENTDIPEGQYTQYLDEDGNLCLNGQIVGKYNIKEFLACDGSYISFLTEEGDIYYWESKGFWDESSNWVVSWEGGLVLSGVEEMVLCDGVYDPVICKMTDGQYSEIDLDSGEIISNIDSYAEDSILLFGDGSVGAGAYLNVTVNTKDQTKKILRNDIELLDQITDIWTYEMPSEDETTQCIVYMLRTDGTVWELNNERIPVKIGDLNGTVIEKGNINGDGAVNVVDLMMCLHYVSGREPLEGDALLAADINGDGIVNVVDLMRILHYVSGRSETL